VRGDNFVRAPQIAAFAGFRAVASDDSRPGVI